jgi:hypothetical protein
MTNVSQIIENLDNWIKFLSMRKQYYKDNIVACTAVAMQQVNKQQCYATRF